jgi:uncharacterized membrane protein YdfJ with MMPL/SSD domain/pSer/pThr/pTyr-binding forkhead associated (FHA) protein
MPTLKMTSGPLAGRTVTLDRPLVVGRQGADLTIDDPELSRRHAVLRPVDGGVEVQDLGSTNGTFVDGRRIDGTEVVRDGGTVQIGSSDITIEPDPSPAAAPAAQGTPAAEAPPAPSGGPRTVLRMTHGTAPGTMIPVGTEPFVIGRGESGMGMLDGDPELSRQHAQISKVDGKVVVEDLGSTNGTFVNGNRIAAPTVLKPGDSLYLGTTALELLDFAPGELTRIGRASDSTIGRVRAAERTLLDRLAAVSYRRSKRMLAGIGIFFVIAVFFGAPVVGLLPSHPEPDPDVESSIALEQIQEASGNQLTPNVIALVETQGGMDSRATRRRVNRVVRTFEEEPLVAQVIDFYSTDDDALVSRDDRYTSIASVFRDANIEDVDDAGDRLAEELEKQPGVLVGGPGRVGPTVGETVGEDIGKAERLAFPILLLASIFIFRGFVAALLPLYVGILTVMATFLALRIVNGAVTEISVFALNMVIALGLGLAIDYSLFIVSRYREELTRSEPGLEPMRRTLKTAGRTVIFSALTVAAALGCLVLFPQSFVYSMGIGGALCSLIAMAISLTALPALLMALGPRVNALSPKRWRKSMERTAAQEKSGFWYRLSQIVMRRPVPFALVSTILLLALGSAFLRIDFVGLDATVLPKDSEVRKVDDLLLTEFPTSRARQINLAVEATPEDRERVTDYANELKPFAGVSDVSPPQQLSNALWQINVFPTHRELDQRTQDLVEEIREQPAPFPVSVAGPTAEFIDQQQSLTDHMPLALGVLCLITVIILFALTGSVILPLKSLVMNALTVSAAFGVLVLIFQDGRLEGLLGYESQGGIESTQPLLLFALSFGLSTDYAVFLLTRIKEARDSGHSERDSVAIGLERTGRIVTAAALLFCIAIGAFATSQIIFIKEVGVGTAFAVAVDATIVRALLVPSLMAMLGRRNWWAPRPLRRLHERVGISEA